MEIQGAVEEILPSVSGKNAKGDTWIKQLVLVRSNEAFDNLYAFEFFGQDRVAKVSNELEVGTEATFSFNVKTNLYNGTYYTNLSVWKIQK